MGIRHWNVWGTRLGRFMRGRRLDRNPLRRASDRMETTVLALLAIAFLAAAPFTALAADGWAFSQAHQAQLAQQASERQVPAVVLKLTSATHAAGTYALGLQQAQARWTAPNGTVVTGELSVPPGTKVGATMPVWSTSAGELTQPPLQGSQVTNTAELAGAFGVVALATVAAATCVLARRALDKRRMAAWDAEWRVIGPRWTTRA